MRIPVIVGRWTFATTQATVFRGGARGIADTRVEPAEEPDPCRRERRALCRAVLQATEAGGEA